MTPNVGHCHRCRIRVVPAGLITPRTRERLVADLDLPRLIKLADAKDFRWRIRELPVDVATTHLFWCVLGGPRERRAEAAQKLLGTHPKIDRFRAATLADAALTTYSLNTAVAELYNDGGGFDAGRLFGDLRQLGYAETALEQGKLESVAPQLWDSRDAGLLLTHLDQLLRESGDGGVEAFIRRLPATAPPSDEKSLTLDELQGAAAEHAIASASEERAGPRTTPPA